jgi:hypothetical protein
MRVSLEDVFLSLITEEVEAEDLAAEQVVADHTDSSSPSVAGSAGEGGPHA